MTYADPLPYATPGATHGSPTAAGAWICIAGLALVFFGGCFCIGILILTSNGFNTGYNGSTPPLTWQQDLLMAALYAAALACFAAGAYVIVLGLRKLMSVGR